jgi:hypothetical protein
MLDLEALASTQRHTTSLRLGVGLVVSISPTSTVEIRFSFEHLEPSVDLALVIMQQPFSLAVAEFHAISESALCMRQPKQNRAD